MFKCHETLLTKPFVSKSHKVRIKITTGFWLGNLTHFEVSLVVLANCSGVAFGIIVHADAPTVGSVVIAARSVNSFFTVAASVIRVTDIQIRGISVAITIAINHTIDIATDKSISVSKGLILQLLVNA